MSVRIVRYGQSDWEVDIRWRSHGGRRQRDRKVLRGTSKSAAHRWGQARERDLLINGPTVKSKEVPTLEAFASRFIDDYAVANRQKPSGIAAKRTILNQHVLPALGGRKLDAITDADVQRLKGQLTHLQPKTVSNILSVLKKLLDMGVEWGVISTPPCRVRLVKFAVSESESYDFKDFDDLVKAAGFIACAIASTRSSTVSIWSSGITVITDLAKPINLIERSKKCWKFKERNWTKQLGC